MSNFEYVRLPSYEGLFDELQHMLSSGELTMSDGELSQQLCLNCVENNNDFLFGAGSLYRKYHNDKEIQVRVQDAKLEQDFTSLCSVFQGTGFEDLYDTLTEKYYVGRVRVIKLKPRSCLSWHRDTHMRLHYPLKTNEGCKMIVGDETMHMSPHNWWKMNTLKWHTAINAGDQDRYHIVTTILGEK